jgi:G:T/U-mismatch repair DNA glycosylase
MTFPASFSSTRIGDTSGATNASTVTMNVCPNPQPLERKLFFSRLTDEWNSYPSLSRGVILARRAR